jgi:hypothetical protein
MADSEDTTQDTPGGEPNRDSVAGRYKPQHDDSDKDGDGKPKDKDDDGKKRWLLLLLLLLILLLLLCAGFAYMKWWKKDPVPAGSSPSPSVVVTTEAPKSPSPSPSPSASPSPTVKTVAMPNVVGKPATEAKTILEAAGFTNIKFVAVDKPTEGLTLLVSFVVTAQSVPAGTQVPVDTALVITCKSSSNGKG